jgi:hypothetical protein
VHNNAATSLLMKYPPRQYDLAISHRHFPGSAMESLSVYGFTVTASSKMRCGISTSNAVGCSGRKAGVLTLSAIPP